MRKFVSSICGATMGHINRTSEVFVDPLNTQCTMADWLSNPLWDAQPAD